MRLSPDFFAQVKNSLSMLGIGMGIFCGYNIYSGNEKFYYKILLPFSHFVLTGENAHKVAIYMGKHNLFPKFSNSSHSELNLNVFGLNFAHPVGIAAGFDKHGEAVIGLLNSGFSYVEVGSVTPEPQQGNPRPRVFRLPKDQAVINRYGFNSDGHAVVLERLRNTQWRDKGILGVNLGINKSSDNPTRDYVEGVKCFGDLCDYLVINISSPNTPGLRQLQKKDSLRKILKEVMATRNTLSKRTPLLLKISPDESDEDIKDIVEVALECKIDGMVVSNTTVSRENLTSVDSIVNETGGLSGKPLADRSNALIARVASLSNYKIPIIGVGGIDSGQDAWTKLICGASLVQLYTSIVYYGPPVVKKVVNELREELHNSGFHSLEELRVKKRQGSEK